MSHIECADSKECCRALSRVWKALGITKMNDKDVAENVTALRQKLEEAHEEVRNWQDIAGRLEDTIREMKQLAKDHMKKQLDISKQAGEG